MLPTMLGISSEFADAQKCSDVEQLKLNHKLTFIVQHLNSVFMLMGWNFLRDGPLNRCECLTINVYKL